MDITNKLIRLIFILLIIFVFSGQVADDSTKANDGLILTISNILSLNVAIFDRIFNKYGYTFTKGANHLDEEYALTHTRIRHLLPAGDRFHRKHIDTIIQKV